MNEIRISPDDPLWQWGPVVVNRTLVFTWVVMLLLTTVSWIITRRFKSIPFRDVGDCAEGRLGHVDSKESFALSKGQNLLEVMVSAVRDQIREISEDAPDPFLGFVGTMFLFLATANLLSIVPGFQVPTASLSTSAALATCVFVAVPMYGIRRKGLFDYLKQYRQPSILMLPFNIIGELSRTLALAVRLYGNMMSGSVIAAILLGFVPLFVPVLMQLFGLLTGMIQAYIFSVLAMVYIASATRLQK
jgi:F-type H+-transporting ATPase subunit a